MSLIEKYRKVFVTNLTIDENQLDGLTYQSVPSWDSVGHMGLITALEEAFDIMIDTDDIVDFSSYEKGKEILKKYNVQL
jgi:acyl carrier protein